MDSTNKSTGVVIKDELISNHCEHNVGKAARGPPEELHPRALFGREEGLVKDGCGGDNL